MKFLKKVTAILIIATIALSSTITSATNTAINGATATPSAIGAIGDTITITKTGIFTAANEITSARITKLDGTAVATTTFNYGAGTDNDTVLTVAGADLTNNLSYIISFTTDTGDFGTTILKLGTPTDDRLTVTASVQPVLKFAMSNFSGTLGILDSDFAGNQVTTNLEIGTNAIGGVFVTASSTNGGLLSGSGHTIKSLKADIYAAEGYQMISSAVVAGSNADSNNTAIITGLTAQDISDSTAYTVYNTDEPQNFNNIDDATFTIQAKIAESTPSASDYTDVIIFTATANF